MTNPDHQRWLDAAAEYVRLRDELKQMQAEMDAVRHTLTKSVELGISNERALFLRDSSIVVLVTYREGRKTTIQVRPVIG